MAQPLFEHVAELLRTKAPEISSKEATQLQDRLRSAISKLKQKIDEDPDHKDIWKEQKAKGDALLKQWIMFQRKLVIKQEHEDLISDGKHHGDTSKATHADVHRSMERTNRVLRDQLELSEAVRRRMDDGTNELKKTHERYAEVKEKLDQTQHLLKQLNHQAYMDKVWIASGILIFTAVVVLIIVERFPRHLVPIFCLILKPSFWILFRSTMESSDSDTSVEGLIHRFRMGYPIKDGSPRRQIHPKQQVEVTSVEDDIQKLHSIVRGRNREATTHHASPSQRLVHHELNMRQRIQSPSHKNIISPQRNRVPSKQQRRAVSPVPPPPLPPRIMSPHGHKSPRARLDDDIAHMLLEEQHQKFQYNHAALQSANPPPSPPPSHEIIVTPSTADIIRKTAVNIDKDMTHILSGFVERNAQDEAAEKCEEQKRESSLPLSALTVATELDAAFELLTKKVISYQVEIEEVPPPKPSRDAQHASHVIRTSSVTTESELHAVLERLERASEVAAATSPQLDHIIHSQLATDDRDLNAILDRIEMVNPSKFSLFNPRALGVDDSHSTDQIDTLIDQLRSIRKQAILRTQAIDHSLLNTAIQNGGVYQRPYEHVPVTTNLDLESSEEKFDSLDHGHLDNEEDTDHQSNLNVSAKDIVEDLNVAMYTLRHRLNLDEREKLEKEEIEKAEMESKAKAAIEEELLKSRQEQELRDAAQARARVMGRTAVEFHGDVQGDDEYGHSTTDYLPELLKPKTTSFDESNVFLRFDMLVRETYDDVHDDPPLSPYYPNNQLDHDGYRPEYLKYPAHVPFSPCKSRQYKSYPHELTQEIKSEYTHPKKLDPEIDYTYYSLADLRRARETKMAWFQQQY